MKNLKTLYLLLAAIFIGVVGYSQDKPITTFTRNINDNAKGLEQSLSPGLDTLRLKSDKDIIRVNFISHTQKETIKIDVLNKEVNIPLYHFVEGRYTIAVYRDNKIIVMGFDRVLPIKKPAHAVGDLEESILRASLPDEELVARHLTPLKREAVLAQSNAIKVESNNSLTTDVKELIDIPPKKESIIAVSIPQNNSEIVSKDIEVAPKDIKESINRNILKEAVKEKVAVVVQEDVKPIEISKENLVETPKVSVNKSTKNNAGLLNNVLGSPKDRSNSQEMASNKKERIESSGIVEGVQRDSLQINPIPRTPREHQRDSIIVRKASYNITDKGSPELEKETREEYRQRNLRPNGTKYD
ncbi:MAG: hypothetical protein KBT58_03715 [Bizionia sp.]|nr:hypothetical protein [Bizionia sp.]